MRRPVPESRNPYNLNKWSRFTTALTAEAGDARVATLQFKDPGGQNVGVPIHADFYLSTSAEGLTVAAATSGAVAAGASGAVLMTVTGRMGVLITNATGEVKISITDTAVRTLYICVRKPTGEIVVSDAIAFV